MKDFLKFIQKAQAKELEELENGLIYTYESRKKSLQNVVDGLEEKRDSESEKHKRIVKDKKKFEQMKSHDFFSNQLMQEIAKKEYFSIVDKKLKHKSYYKKWIESGKDHIKQFGKGKLDEKLKQPGFIFESDNVRFEYTRDTYFTHLFEENKKKLLNVLFKK